MALGHWYEAAEYVMAQKREVVSPGEDSFFNYESDEKLNALISGSRKLRKVIEHYNLMETPLPRTPSNMLTWIDDETLQEQLQLELSKDQDHENSSDTESFVSASDNAQLEVQYMYMYNMKTVDFNFHTSFHTTIHVYTPLSCDLLLVT